MNEIKIAWQPVNSVDLDFIRDQLLEAFGSETAQITILGNGTALFVYVISTPENDAKIILSENSLPVDFKVAPLGSHGYLVMLNAATAVFVGEDEFLSNRQMIKDRVDGLKYPTEVSIVPQAWSEDEYFIGLYGRAKYMYDVNNFRFFCRLDPQ